jgi:4'-phosphopantetheinyl transferase
MSDNLSDATIQDGGNLTANLSETVHIWSVTLVGPRLDLDNVSILSPDEQQRAATFRMDCHRRRFVAARVALRSVLAQYLRILPGELRFGYEPLGKPRLLTDSERPLQFNLSHSDDLALIAVTTAPVGVDLERVPHVGAWDALEPVAARFFSAADRDALTALPPRERRRAFYQIWTRKEAHLKGCGLGVAMGLDRFSLVPAGDARSWRVRDEQGGFSRWCVTDLDAGGEYVAALALDAEIRNVVWRNAESICGATPTRLLHAGAHPQVRCLDAFLTA